MINLINTDNNRSKPTNSSRWATRFLKEMHLDVFLFIDYRRDYLAAHRAMPNIPVSPRRQSCRCTHRIYPHLLLLTHMPVLPLHRSFSGHVIHAPRSRLRASR